MALLVIGYPLVCELQIESHVNLLTLVIGGREVVLPGYIIENRVVAFEQFFEVPVLLGQAEICLEWHNKFRYSKFEDLVADGFTKDGQEELILLRGIFADVNVVILASDLVCDPVLGNITKFIDLLIFTLKRIHLDDIWGSLLSLLPEIHLDVFEFPGEPWNFCDSDSNDWDLFEKFGLCFLIFGLTAKVRELSNIDFESVAGVNALSFRVIVEE